MLRSDIPEMYHESILQKLAYVAFEMGKESEFSKLTQEQMLALVEVHVKKAFEKGMNGHIAKPIDAQILYEVLDKLAKKQQ